MEIDLGKSKTGGGQFSALRWNGTSKTTERWSTRSREPALWNKDGKCLVYLNAKASSHSSPAFKIVFSDLVAAKCQPLIEKYIHFANHTLNTAPKASVSDEKTTVELYIPHEADLSTTTKRHHHITMRNLLAWAAGHPIVGEHLGPALTDLMFSMRRYRNENVDNVADMMKYLESQGYLNYSEQPSFALGVLNFAEQTQLRELYINAFCHCVGMTDKISSNSEYMTISLHTRGLLRKARVAMNGRLKRTTKMLRDFLEAELSEAFLGLQPRARAALNQYRSFLLSYYKDDLASQYNVLHAEVLNAMHQDFVALYNFLVDDDCEFSGTMSSSAGGICILQAVQSFETRHKIQPLPHALPLLPAIEEAASSFLTQWIPRMDRGKSNAATQAHEALSSATNWREDLRRNNLVQAYMRFEAECAAKINRLDKAEKANLVDGRKVRWILTYATYQVIRNAALRPAQVQADESPYHLSVSTDNLPSWDRPATAATSRPGTSMTEGTIGWKDLNWMPENNESRPPTARLDIKPDVDYYALTHKEPPPRIQRRSSIAVAASRTTQALSRSASVTRALTRSYTFRRSRRQSKDAAPTAEETTPAVPPVQNQQQPYHEIVVHGYGNGTNDVNVDTTQGNNDEDRSGVATRKNSTVSKSESSMSVRESVASSVDDLWSSSKGTTPTSPMTEASEEECPTPPCWSKPDDVSAQAIERNSSRRSLTRLHSFKSALTHASSVKRASTFERRNSIKESLSLVSSSSSSGGLARSHSLRLPDLRRRRSYKPEAGIPPIEVDENGEQPWGAQEEEEDEWDAMETFLEGGSAPKKAPAWEQYSNLGGLIEV